MPEDQSTFEALDSLTDELSEIDREIDNGKLHADEAPNFDDLGDVRLILREARFSSAASEVVDDLLADSDRLSEASHERLRTALEGVLDERRLEDGPLERLLKVQRRRHEMDLAQLTVDIENTVGSEDAPTVEALGEIEAGKRRFSEVAASVVAQWIRVMTVEPGVGIRCLQYSMQVPVAAGFGGQESNRVEPRAFIQEVADILGVVPRWETTT